MLPIRAASAVKSFTRTFSTTRKVGDMAKTCFIGRVGADPSARETKDGRPYYTYPLGVSVGPVRQSEDGKPLFPDTFWHTIFAFNPNSHDSIKRIGKGSVIYLEAELEMRNSEPINEQFVPPRVVLKHQTFRMITKKEPGRDEGGGEAVEAIE
ncbi:MAG: hypothetical protein TREMPRED_002285 [Tremellales sp. Tagirdzhanova-0007]|nr:MAG: hypothetical protein TREMPRED_002285 [Tremellales sp. Tagirdzhanova-0007]